MNVQQQVQEAASPQEALAVIARGLDALFQEIQDIKAQRDAALVDSSTWGTWDTGRPEDRVKVTEDADGNTEVELPPVTDEMKDKRRKFARNIGLEDDNIEYYAKGGPLWLYLGDREFVMGLPVEWRRDMVQDVMETGLTKDAEEMGRDVLKDEGPGNVERAYEDHVAAT